MGLNANVLNNTLDFLRRVDMKGLEAFAFVEAYVAIQNEHAMASNPPPAPLPVAPPVDNAHVADGCELFG